MNHYICQKGKKKTMTSTMESNEMERLLRSLARVQEQPRPQTEKESPKKIPWLEPRLFRSTYVHKAV